MRRLKGQPLANLEAERVIQGFLNILIPFELFPFTKREALRESLRQIVEISNGQKIA